MWLWLLSLSLLLDTPVFCNLESPESLRHVYSWLSLLASAVGSQAAITATFSIIKQCLALDCLPRMKVVHTSNKIHGQVYIPDVNWILMVLCLAVTFAFRNIPHIGYAIGKRLWHSILPGLITTCGNLIMPFRPCYKHWHADHYLLHVADHCFVLG